MDKVASRFQAARPRRLHHRSLRRVYTAADCRRRLAVMTLSGAQLLLRAINSVYDTCPRLGEVNTTDLETTFGNSHPEQLFQTLAQNLFVREHGRRRGLVRFLVRGLGGSIGTGGQSRGGSLEDKHMLPVGNLHHSRNQ